MPSPTKYLAVAFSSLLLSTLASAQHCGGPCEVPRGSDPESANPKYTLSEGVESANWRYLYNWHWTEDGVQTHELERSLKAAPLCDFTYRRMFVSPAGNGFLVTGNPYAETEELKGEQSPLFVFCDPRGNALAQFSLFDVLEGDERVLGPCPSCDCCTDHMYVFAQDPQLSRNGCFVELVARGTNRSVDFYLPWGCIVRDRQAFESALEAAEWSRLPKADHKEVRSSIDELIVDLGSDELAVRTRAAAGLRAQGLLARSALQRARSASKSGNFRARATELLAGMRPLGGSPWETLSYDLGLLKGALSYPDKGVQRTLRAHLAEILPPTSGLTDEACAAWIDKHAPGLKWDATKRRYTQ